MARRVFFSFHYGLDHWRAAQVRNVGVVEGNVPVSDNDWESVTRGGDAAIRRWIDWQLNGTSCAVVLIGSATAGRKWINYEIKRAWGTGKGLVGVHIHNLKDQFGNPAPKGSNPFAGFTLNNGATPLSSVARTYDPPYIMSTHVFGHIKQNLATWVEDAVFTRSRWP
ncbi:MAG TPA: TIR domain-containing protein [Thermoanaerobaculia bacterium]|nr:TIR domain-containing protein [Thermoanaerobaculia bacterium]